MYSVYILQCADNTLYTGITTDLVRRVKEHNSTFLKVGAKYTRARQPVTLVWSKKYKSRSEASIEEARVKKLKRVDKLKLISS